MIGSEEIEIINAYVPYSHGMWANNGIQVGGDRSLGSRSELLAESIKRFIVNTYPGKQIEKLTLLDVGCYDGWLTNEIAQLGFSRVVGLEAREKNIEKGKIVRRVLGIECKVEFLLGDIRQLNDIFKNEQFDIVICCGLMHHLSSCVDAIAMLGNVSRETLIVNTICLPDFIVPQNMGKLLELKDVPYFYKEKVFGFSGFKYESGYYDGSAANDSIVGIPSESLIKMAYEINLFSQPEIITTIEEFDKSLGQTHRKFSEVTIAAKKSEKSLIEGLGQQYEIDLANCTIGHAVFDQLEEILAVGDNEREKDLKIIKVLDKFGFNQEIDLGGVYSSLEGYENANILSEIYKNIWHSPCDKACVEVAKVLVSKAKYEEAISFLHCVTRKPNSDWRSVYRAFYLLYTIYYFQGSLELAHRYQDLLLKSNPNFPLCLLKKK